MTQRRKGIALAIAALALIAGACSSSDGTATGESEPDPTTSGTASPGTAAPTSNGVAPAELEIIGTDFAFELSAPSVPAGAVAISLTNEGGEEHQATILRLRDGKTPEDMAALSTDPTAISETVFTFGGPNAVAPGSTLTTTVQLEDGSYIVVCFIPSPDDGISHADKGMVTPLEVTAATDDPAEPAADEEIVLADYSFELPDGFTGDGAVRVRNDGEEFHELAAYRLADGATIDDVMAILSTPPGSGPPPEGPPPFSPAGGVAALDPGESNVVDLDLEPGEYVLLCFLPAQTDGLPHFLKGMVQPLTIE